MQFDPIRKGIDIFAAFSFLQFEVFSCRLAEAYFEIKS
jgi:hypothetical protein